MTSNTMTATAAGDSAAKAEGRAPGQWSMWVFVLGDMLIFAGWFAFYMHFRMKDPGLYLQSQQALDQTSGVINTLILLFSSWAIARCVDATRKKLYNKAVLYTWLSIVAGFVFVGVKVFEWSSEIRAGHGFESNYFFLFYFFLTGVHVFHVLIGLIALGVVVREVRTSEFRSQEVVESCATYWHMVDFLWVIIFALLYLMR